MGGAPSGAHISAQGSNFKKRLDEFNYMVARSNYAKFHGNRPSSLVGTDSGSGNLVALFIILLHFYFVLSDPGNSTAATGHGLPRLRQVREKTRCTFSAHGIELHESTRILNRRYPRCFLADLVQLWRGHSLGCILHLHQVSFLSAHAFRI